MASITPSANVDQTARSWMGYSGLRMNSEQFLAVEETREHYHLVDGVVVKSPSATGPHQRILRLIQKQLEAYIDNGHAEYTYYPDIDIRMSPNTVHAPDLSCYAPGRIDSTTAYPSVAADLVIEILYPGTKAFDLTTKKHDYERYGVKEYITVDSAPK